ncbi:hypothetical protein BT93_A1102 [Corymbia citriodora subsp. variegata]|nr:hypothetical protein BT93_A1102 [Corymbia citriodora subsp. variegata]
MTHDTLSAPRPPASFRSLAAAVFFFSSTSLTSRDDHRSRFTDPRYPGPPRGRLHPYTRMSRKGAPLQKDVPWRASASKPIPKIHHNPVLRVAQTPYSNYAISVMKQHPDPIGSGLGIGAVVEAAGPDCIVPGQIPPVKLLGVKVWPINVDLKFMEPVERELKSLGKFLDSAVNLMNKSFIDR